MASIYNLYSTPIVSRTIPIPYNYTYDGKTIKVKGNDVHTHIIYLDTSDNNSNTYKDLHYYNLVEGKWCHFHKCQSNLDNITDTPKDGFSYIKYVSPKNKN